MACLASENFGNGHAFIFSLMREHGPTHNIAKRVNARHARLKMMINHDAAAIHCDACGFKAKTFRVRTPPNRHQHNIGINGLRIAACGGFNGNLRTLLAGFNARDLVAKMELETLLFQHALKLLGYFEVHARQDAVEIFNHCHFSTETAPDRAHFKTDHACANNYELARHLIERERAS